MGLVSDRVLIDFDVREGRVQVLLLLGVDLVRAGGVRGEG